MNCSILLFLFYFIHSLASLGPSHPSKPPQECVCDMCPWTSVFPFVECAVLFCGLVLIYVNDVEQFISSCFLPLSFVAMFLMNDPRC